MGISGPMRDEFSVGTKELLAKRVGYRCSNPECRQPTSGPQEDPAKVVNIGVAAHITAASPDGCGVVRRQQTALREPAHSSGSHRAAGACEPETRRPADAGRGPEGAGPQAV